MTKRAYLVVLAVGDFEKNKIYDTLPLHCTLVHWFYANLNPSELSQVINDQVRVMKPIKLVSISDDYFGPSDESRPKVHVNLIEKTESLLRMHCVLCDALKEANVEFTEPTYVSKGYEPHVTRTTNAGLDVGTEYFADRLYLVEALNADEISRKQVVGSLKLEEEFV
jgi:2'-5' RNA ligase